MRIRDFMSKEIFSISPDQTVAAAREKLHLNEVDHLVVMTGQRVVGVVSIKDIGRAPDDRQVHSIMSKGVASIGPTATLRKAAGMMRGRAVGCLPVIDDGKLVGIVTTSDVLTALSRGEVHATAPPRARFILRKRGIRKRPLRP